MTNTTNPQAVTAPFLPTTQNIPEEEDRRRVFLVDRFSNFADVINDKKIGVYISSVPTFNGEAWFYITGKVKRAGYEVFYYIPSLPNTGTLVINATSDPPYPIPFVNSELVITMLYGTASKQCSAIGAGDGDYFQYNNKGDTRISFTLSDTTLTLTTTTDLSAYSGFIVISFLRNGV